MKIVIYGSICLLLFSVTDCSRQPQETIIARVDNAALTLEDAMKRIDTTRVLFKDQLLRYITQWVNEELINQEALRRGMDNSARLQYKLREANKLIINQYFLDQYIYSGPVSFNEQILQEYYKKHETEFIVQEDAIKINMITLESRERASFFVSSVLRGSKWQDAVNTIKQDTSLASGIILNSSETYFTQHTLFPVELWKVASTLKMGEVSYPVKTSLGYSAIQVISSIKKGERADYSIVRDEIRERFIIEQRRLKYKELLDQLHKNHRVDILIKSTAASDSSETEYHE